MTVPQERVSFVAMVEMVMEVSRIALGLPVTISVMLAMVQVGVEAAEGPMVKRQYHLEEVVFAPEYQELF